MVKGRISPGTYFLWKSISGQSCYIKKGDWHQIENPCKTPAKIIETWIGDYLDEDDITRHD